MNKICLHIVPGVLHKYLLLAGTLAILFLDEKPIDLGKCTSHLLEHFFGLIRRFCMGNNSKEKFEQSLLKALCLQMWTFELMLNSKIPGRQNQDSAAVIEEGSLEPSLASIKFGSFVKAAYKIFYTIFMEKSINFDTVFPKLGNWVQSYDDILYMGRPLTIESIFHFNFSNIQKKPNTLKQENSIASGGLINARQQSEAYQVDQRKK